MYVPLVSELRNLLSSVEDVLGITLAIFYSTADYSTTTEWILIPFVGACWARLQLRNCIRYISVLSKLRKSLSSVERVLAIKLAILYSTADHSTTARWILIPFEGDRWARRQLHNGVWYVSVASKLMNPPTLLRVVFRLK